MPPSARLPPPLGKRTSSPHQYPPPLGTRASRPRTPKPPPTRKWIALAFLLPTTLTLAQNPPPNTPPTAQQPDASTLLQQFFYEIKHLQADFTQLEFDIEGAFRRQSTGRLYLSRPGRFRIDYLEPDEVIIWADGESLSMFDPELEQVTVWKQATRLKESAAALLAGDASVLENYQVNVAEFEDGLQWFDLATTTAEEGDLRLALRGKAPAVIEYSDELGSRVQMQLFRLDLKSKLDDKLFNPDIPPGVDIFEAVES